MITIAWHKILDTGCSHIGTFLFRFFRKKKIIIKKLTILLFIWKPLKKDVEPDANANEPSHGPHDND